MVTISNINGLGSMRFCRARIPYLVSGLAWEGVQGER